MSEEEGSSEELQEQDQEPLEPEGGEELDAGTEEEEVDAEVLTSNSDKMHIGIVFFLSTGCR